MTGTPRRRGDERPPAWTTAAALFALLALVYLLRDAPLPVALPAALAFALRPAVGALQRRLRVRESTAVLIVYLAVLGAVAALGYGLVAGASDRLVEAAADAPRLAADAVRRLVGPKLHLFGHDLTAEEAAGRLLDGLG